MPASTHTSNTALNRLRVPDLLVHFHLRNTPENRALMRAIRWLPKLPTVRIQGVYSIVDTTDWWMRIGFSTDIWRRCYIEHDGALRRRSHECLELQSDCAGIDGKRWRVLILEEVRDLSRWRMREKWWREGVKKEFEREEHRSRWESGSRNRRPSC